jgi:hypothetical protein
VRSALSRRRRIVRDALAVRLSRGASSTESRSPPTEGNVNRPSSSFSVSSKPTSRSTRGRASLQGTPTRVGTWAEARNPSRKPRSVLALGGATVRARQAIRGTKPVRLEYGIAEAVGLQRLLKSRRIAEAGSQKPEGATEKYFRYVVSPVSICRVQRLGYVREKGKEAGRGRRRHISMNPRAAK